MIYEYCWDHQTAECGNDACVKGVIVAPARTHPASTFLSRLNVRLLGMALLAIGLGGMVGPLVPKLKLEAGYLIYSARQQAAKRASEAKPLPSSVPVVFDPLVTPDGASIAPVNESFSLIIPKIGVNAPVVPGVNPMRPNEYLEALKTGVAHANTSFYPNEDGTVYLFSHSTNYEWFVRDLNAVFYLMKELEKGDLIVLIYQGKRYSYRMTDKRVVSPKDVTYLAPVVGNKNLILQTCWPPGSVSERLLIFADLMEVQGIKI